MSRLDYVTITIVVICLFALGFLVWKTVGLMGKGEKKSPKTEQTTQDPEESDTYSFDDEGAVIDEEDSPEEFSNDLDLDDEELDSSSDYELIDEEDGEPADDSTEDEVVPDSEVVEEDVPAERITTSSSSSGEYMVLAGSFKVKGNADKQVSRLRKLGYDDAGVEVFDRGAYAVVLVDRFESLSDAKSLVKELRDEHGIKSFVKKKQ